jgi:hypothetical protein
MMFSYAVEQEARKGAGLGRGRPRTWYTFDGIRLTGIEWAAHLGITVQQFYRRLRKHEREPATFPAWQVFAEHFGETPPDER